MRPSPASSRSERLKAAVLAALAPVSRLQRRTEPAAEPPVPLAAPPDPVAQPLAVIALAAIGAAVLAVGLLWGWQRFSNRSAEPVDDLLPRLVVAAEPDPSPVPTTAVRVPVGPSQAAQTDGTHTAVVAEPTASMALAVTPGPVVPEVLVVHVAGAVHEPGVVELASGSRVFHAVQAVGGASGDADLDRVNLAAPILDGERLWIPVVGEPEPPSIVASERPPIASLGSTPFNPINPALAESAISGLPIDLNLASQSDLESLPGIGPALAQAIVTTRAERGPFRSVDELVEVAGIGPATLERLRSRIVVQRPPAGG